MSFYVQDVIFLRLVEPLLIFGFHRLQTVNVGVSMDFVHIGPIWKTGSFEYVYFRTWKVSNSVGWYGNVQSFGGNDLSNNSDYMGEKMLRINDRN